MAKEKVGPMIQNIKHKHLHNMIHSKSFIYIVIYLYIYILKEIMKKERNRLLPILTTKTNYVEMMTYMMWGFWQLLVYIYRHLAFNCVAMSPAITPT